MGCLFLSRKYNNYFLCVKDKVDFFKFISKKMRAASA